MLRGVAQPVIRSQINPQIISPRGKNGFVGRFVVSAFGEFQRVLTEQARGFLPFLEVEWMGDDC